MPEFVLKSDAFEDRTMMPDEYTCRGSNISPPLAWEHPPESTACFALLAVDLDTPFGIMTHWIVYDVPADVTHLPAAVSASELAERGIRQGRNAMLRRSYMGPCPPWGTHRYVFTILALDKPIEFNRIPTRGAFRRLVAPHTVATAELVGLYSKKAATRA